VKTAAKTENPMRRLLARAGVDNRRTVLRDKPPVNQIQASKMLKLSRVIKGQIKIFSQTFGHVLDCIKI
jgi:hypothetical protein